MKTKKTIAFITAITMLAGAQSVFVNAAEQEVPEVSVTEETAVTEETEEAVTAEEDESEYDYSVEYDDGGLLKSYDITDEELDEWRAEACVWDKENGTIGGWDILGQVKNAEGKEYYYTWGGSGGGYTCYAQDDLTVLGVSNAVARPGQRTYIDISVDGATELSVLYGLLKYDRSALKLVSASIDESVECAVREPSEEHQLPDFTAAQNGCFMYFNNDLKNVDLSGEHTIRFGFEVSEDAAEGEYEIGITNTENGGLTGLARNEYTADNSWLFVYVPVKYVSGSIKVSKTEMPATNLQPKPLRRTYAMIDDENSIITGDVNEDGTINVLDVIYEKDCLVDSESTVKNTDTNEDGIVNIADVLTLTKYMLE